MFNRAMRRFREEGFLGVLRAAVSRMEKRRHERALGPVREEWTNYMTWLGFANPGMLDRGNVQCMNYAIQRLPSAAPMVEIGSFCGLSTNMLAYLKAKNGATNPLFSCDPWAFEGAVGAVPMDDHTRITHDEYREFVKESFQRNARFFSRDDLPHAIESTSDDFFRSWAASETRRDVFGAEAQLGGPISFCYIDGNHQYDCAKRDFHNCDRFLERGGFVLFDDSADGSGWEVCRVVSELRADPRYELIAQAPNYFFRKR